MQSASLCLSEAARRARRLEVRDALAVLYVVPTRLLCCRDHTTGALTRVVRHGVRDAVAIEVESNWTGIVEVRLHRHRVEPVLVDLVLDTLLGRGDGPGVSANGGLRTGGILREVHAVVCERRRRGTQHDHSCKQRCEHELLLQRMLPVELPCPSMPTDR